MGKYAKYPASISLILTIAGFTSNHTGWLGTLIFFGTGLAAAFTIHFTMEAVHYEMAKTVIIKVERRDQE